MGAKMCSASLVIRQMQIKPLNTNYNYFDWKDNIEYLKRMERIWTLQTLLVQQLQKIASFFKS